MKNNDEYDKKGVEPMTRIICLSLFLLLMTLSVSAEAVTLQAVVPDEAGTIALTFTLDEPIPAMIGLSSGIGSDRWCQNLRH
jgi:hypothetical protein